MPNIHTPQRLEGESQEDYKKRRLASWARNEWITKGPHQHPYIGNPAKPNEGPNMRLWWLGQHTNKNNNQHRKAVKAAGGIRQYNKHAKMMRQLIGSRAHSDHSQRQLAEVV